MINSTRFTSPTFNPSKPTAVRFGHTHTHQCNHPDHHHHAPKPEEREFFLKAIWRQIQELFQKIGQWFRGNSKPAESAKPEPAPTKPHVHGPGCKHHHH